MTEKEKELISLVREAENSENAMCVAVGVILEFLERLESSQEQCPVCLRESS